MSSEQTNETTSLTRSQRFTTYLNIFLVLGAILGILAFLGLAVFYIQYVQPLQESVEELEARMQKNEDQISQRLDDIADRLAVIEDQSEGFKEALADLEVQLETIETSQETLAAGQSEIAEDFQALGNEVSDMETRLGALESDLQAYISIKETLQSKLETLQEDVEAASSFISGFNQNAETISEQIASYGERWQALENEVQLLKAMELLTRSRILLVQGNTDLARADIQDARDLLANLSGKVSDFQETALLEITNRLDNVLERINTAPTSVVNLLESAWKLLFTGLPDE
jgi:DNA repair exonuclease SbcCD ATPase subunit